MPAHRRKELACLIGVEPIAGCWDRGLQEVREAREASSGISCHAPVVRAEALDMRRQLHPHRAALLSREGCGEAVP